MRALTLGLLILLGAGRLMAGPLPPDLSQSYEQFFLNIMDDPSGIARWARERLDRPRADFTDQERAKLIAIYGGTCYELRCVDDPYFNETAVREALRIAETSGMAKTLIMRLHLMLDYIVSGDLDLDTSIRNLDRLKIKAEQLGGGRILADVYREYSGVFESYDDKPKALMYAQKALEEIKKETFPADLLAYMLQYDAGTLIARMGDLERARTFYKEPLEFCRREKIRHYGALILTNLARSHVKTELPAEIDLGLKMVEEAEALMQDLEEPMVRSYIAIVRGDAWYRRRDLARASQFYQEAHGRFIKAQSATWQAESAFSVAQTEKDRGRFAEALGWLEKFEGALKGSVSDAIRAAHLRAGILKGLGRPAEAVDALESVLRMRDQQEKETQEGEISRLRSQLEFAVQEKRNELLQRDNELKSQQLQEVIAGAVIVLIFFGLSVRQTRKLKKAQATIHNILEYIEEGIITIGRGFKVEASLSPYIDRLIEPEGAGHQDVFHKLLQRIDSSEHDKQLIQDTLEACMGSNALTWELNAAHLPIEVTIDQGARILALDWRPILGRGQAIESILLVLRDQSVRRRLEQQLSAEQDRLLRTTHLMQEIIRAQPRRVRRLLNRIREQAGDLKNPRILHTVKGDARTLGLPSLVTRTHALESASTPADWEAWWDLVKQYEKLLENFEESSQGPKSADEISLHEIALEIQEGLKPHLQSHHLHFQRFCVDDGWGPADFDREGVRTVLLHALTNAIDHGFILPSQNRGFKQDAVSIAITARSTAMHSELIIEDNGAGIDRESLNRKFNQGRPLSDDAIQQLLLSPGVTTADRLTETSGRGVGLHAIQGVLSDWSGTIRLSSGPGSGTRLELSWPHPRARIAR